MRPQRPGGESSAQCPVLRIAEANQNWRARFRFDQTEAYRDLEKSGPSRVVGKKSHVGEC